MTYEELPYIEIVIRDAAILTTSYVAATEISPANVSAVVQSIQVDSLNQLVLLVDFTKGSLTSLQIKVESSNDGLNWYQTAVSEITAGTGTTDIRAQEFNIVTTGKVQIAMPIKAERI